MDKLIAKIILNMIKIILTIENELFSFIDEGVSSNCSVIHIFDFSISLFFFFKNIEFNLIIYI